MSPRFLFMELYISPYFTGNNVLKFILCSLFFPVKHVTFWPFVSIFSISCFDVTLLNLYAVLLLIKVSFALFHPVQHVKLCIHFSKDYCHEYFCLFFSSPLF